MNDKLQIWNSVNQPPKEALKQIQGGRLKGMTDINPQWRMKALTELFGPCGIGWKYEIVEHWVVHLESGEAPCFVIVNLYIHDEEKEKWSDPIPGIGGSGLVAKETSGLRVNDEAFKMATTDALSVAMKSLGVAADIYAGLWDGSKYKVPNEQIDPAPINMKKVTEAVVFFKAWIDKDVEDEEKVVPIKNYYHGLTNDERIEMAKRMEDKAPGTNKMYKNILKGYLEMKS